MGLEDQARNLRNAAHQDRQQGNESAARQADCMAMQAERQAEVERIIGTPEPGRTSGIGASSSSMTMPVIVLALGGVVWLISQAGQLAGQGASAISKSMQASSGLLEMAIAPSLKGKLEVRCENTFVNDGPLLKKPSGEMSCIWHNTGPDTLPYAKYGIFNSGDGLMAEGYPGEFIPPLSPGETVTLSRQDAKAVANIRKRIVGLNPYYSEYQKIVQLRNQPDKASAWKAISAIRTAQKARQAKLIPVADIR